MNLAVKINEQLQQLVAQGDWRFALGLHFRFNHPTLMYQSYPEEWVQHYAKNGLMFSDPALFWGMTNFGVCDWRELETLDSGGVLRMARDFGLAHGISVSVGNESQRSLGFFTHHEHPIREDWRETAQVVLTNLHDLTKDVALLSPEELAELAALNVPPAN